MDYREALDWLYSTQMFGIKLGLENAHRLVAALDAYPKTCKIIHVAGTNGKGSVCAMAESIARAEGLRTGLFTSPHLVRYNERIKIDGKDISDEEIAHPLTFIRLLVADWEPHPTFFEITTALGLFLFKRQKCEIIILETGMGGRLDATNIVTPGVSVLTRIDLDHAQWLGNTLEKIASEKAGIIKQAVPVITIQQTPEVLQVFQSTANYLDSELEIIETPYSASPLALLGLHQKYNAALAIRALELIGVYPAATVIADALQNVIWPGRFQEIRPGIFLDGAHNPAAAERLVETWEKYGPGISPTIIIGMLADKDAHETIAALAPLAAAWITVAPRSPRSLAPTELAKEIQKISVQPIEVSDSLVKSIIKSPPPLLICGSLFLVGEALVYFTKAAELRHSAQ